MKSLWDLCKIRKEWWKPFQGVKTKGKDPILWIVILSLFLLWSRWIQHPANLSPVLAICLVSGWLGRGRWYALFFPLLAFFLSDFYLGFYPGWVFTYVPLAFVVWFGSSMKKTLVSFVGWGWGAAFFFFLVSNFGVWIQAGLYSPDWEGLLLCYQMALPFFRASLVGTTLFLTGFYLLNLCRERIPGRKLIFH